MMPRKSRKRRPPGNGRYGCFNEAGAMMPRKSRVPLEIRFRSSLMLLQ